jgi:hypothetical protein
VADHRHGRRVDHAACVSPCRMPRQRSR